MKKQSFKQLEARVLRTVERRLKEGYYLRSYRDFIISGFGMEYDPIISADGGCCLRGILSPNMETGSLRCHLTWLTQRQETRMEEGFEGWGLDPGDPFFDLGRRVRETYCDSRWPS